MQTPTDGSAFPYFEQGPNQSRVLVVPPHLPYGVLVQTPPPQTVYVPLPSANDSSSLSVLQFTLNGKSVTVNNPDPEMTLNEYLRTVAGLKGTKKSCGEGGCGACTVMVSYVDANNETRNMSVNSCLKPLCAVNGMSVTTIEGIGNNLIGYHPIQQRLAEYNGTQCGFCSPGMVMNMYGLLQDNPNPTEAEIERHYDGNICRCTGYRPILSAMKTFASDSVCSKKDCCKKGKLKDMEDLCKDKYNRSKDPSVKKIAVPKSARPLKAVKDGSIYWLEAQSLQELYTYLAAFSYDYQVKLVVGNTSKGVFKDESSNIYINIRSIPELNIASVGKSGVKIGAATPISVLLTLLEGWSKSLPAGQVTHFQAMIEHIYRIANSAVRNAGSLGGNLMMIHSHNDFPSDLFIVMMGANATVTVGSTKGTVENIPLDQFLTMDMTAKALLSLTIPFSNSGEFYKSYKVATRHVNSHAIVNAAMQMTLSNNVKISNPILAFGGVCSTPVRAVNTEGYISGRSVTDSSTFQQALAILQTEIVPSSDDVDGQYKKSVVCSLFYKFWLSALPTGAIPPQYLSATTGYARGVSSGKQSYQTNPIEYPITEPMSKLHATQQTAGEAQYTDDIPTPQGTIFAAFVTSNVNNGQISAIDMSAAEKCPGYIGFISANDVTPTQNNVLDFPLFSSGSVVHYGQAIGLILADTQAHADDAAKAVQNGISYTGGTTPILTLEDAIASNSFYDEVIPAIETGNIQQGFDESDFVLSGSVACGSQYHFHLETQTVMTMPSPDTGMIVYSATQMPAIVQASIAAATSTPINQIDVRVRRLGGGYGGKLNNSIFPAMATSIAAQKFNAPVKMVMSLQTNMEMLGKRHPYLTYYKVGFDRAGNLKAANLTSYVDSGSSLTDTVGSTEVFLLSVDNVYNFKNFRATAKLCKTNTPPNTDHRGPGWVQAVFTAEHIIEHVAEFLGFSPDKIREQNFYKTGETTPGGHTFKAFNLPLLWNQIQQDADYLTRAKQVETYNRENRWTKKGLAMIPMRFGVGWGGARYTSQISIYVTDGTVSVTHSGIECGQGINVKVAQAVAWRLGIPVSMVTVTTTSTLMVPDGSPTGGSITSELCAEASLQACDTLNSILLPFRKSLTPSSTWQQLINAATAGGAVLTARSTIQPPNNPNVFDYDTFGVAICQEWVDILTGEIEIERVDVLMDVGASMNPAVDIGQAEGGFIHGLGYYISEFILYDTSGKLITNGTWEYKPVSSADIPIDFRVSLMPNLYNKVGVLRSKAIGEPPLCLSCSGLFAAKRAISAALSDINVTGYFPLDAPATTQKIQLASQVDPSQFTIN